MPRPTAPLPTTDEVFERLDRPPWHAVSSVELANLLGVHLNTIWNYTLRGTGPTPEPPNAHVRASNRRFFLPCIVLAWLSAREGAPVAAWEWNRRWLAENGLLDARDPDPGPAGVLRVIRALDAIRVLPRRWKVRAPHHLASLETPAG